MKTWFNGLAREVLTGEDLPVREPRVATGNTVATFQEYPNLSSENSGSDVEMEGPSPSDGWPGGDEAAVSAPPSPASSD